MSDKAILEINLNEEYKIKIEKGNQFEESIFHEVYKEALKNVIEIVRHYYSHKDSKYDDFNNIIAFTGERGKGKSSSMISFQRALVNKIHTENKPFFDKSDYSSINNKSFAEIDIIDPSLFRDSEGLFEIILAKMFQKFQESLKDTTNKINQDDRRNLIKSFQEVYQDLQIIIDRKELYKKDAIEALSKLATSSSLRDRFGNLIEDYLSKYEKKDFLIIVIDDFDINIERVYKMLEEIRQFLIQKKVILLIACKIQQINEALEINYKNLQIKEIEIENKVKRYVDKLIPFYRRIFLPDVQKLKNISINILSEEIPIFSNDKFNFNKSIIKLVYEQNAILLSENILSKNFILPETIRETQSFLGVFSIKNNLLNIKNYLLDEIYKDNVERVVFEELEDVAEELFNFSAFRKIYKLYNDYYENLLFDQNLYRKRSYNKTLKNIFDSKVIASVSIGDMYYLLQEFENLLTIDDYDLLKFLDYFKSYYAVKILLISPSPTKLNMTKYGFVNNFSKILSREEGIKPRDFFQFNKLTLNTLKNDERFILSLFIFYLGNGYQTYRKDPNKDIFVGTNQGIFSPIAILHNIFNIDDLSDVLNFSKDSDFIKSNINWFEKSEFIKQMYSPSFALNLLDSIKDFRLKEIKETLPLTYFDNICLQFVYGIIYSLDKIELRYNIKGLVVDFVSYPVIKILLKYFNNTSYKLGIISDLNHAYNILELIKVDFEINDSLINIINEIFKSPPSKNIEDEKNILQEILTIINNNNSYTSAKYSGQVQKLRKLQNTENTVNKIESLKKKINSKDIDVKKNAQEELKIFLNSKLNG
ncbi:hypothetical protein [Chryseobacterium gambrini]|uniref:hypothetical protein n=1 Tax=Chryseobacterium gambrini TaxID=373672 RepID=UPI003BA83DC2